MVLKSRDGWGHVVVINGHTLAGKGSFPSSLQARTNFKATCFQNHVVAGMIKLKTLAKAQGYQIPQEMFEKSTLVVLGDWNMSQKEIENALGACPASSSDADAVTAVGEGSLWTVSISDQEEASKGQKIWGPDNAHLATLAAIKWPGQTVQDCARYRR